MPRTTIAHFDISRCFDPEARGLLHGLMVGLPLGLTLWAAAVWAVIGWLM